MSHQFSPAVEQLIRAKTASGHYTSEDDLILEALQSLDERDEELRAIEEGLASVDRGDKGVSVDEAFQRLRSRHSTSGER